MPDPLSVISSYLQATVNLLSDDSTIRFFATCINFMHEEYVKTSALYDSSLESKVSAADMARAGSMRKSPGGAGVGKGLSRGSVSMMSR
jgi:hypothetical protein